MKSIAGKLVILAAVAFAVSSCGNTIRGVGHDTSNAINATQDAGRNIDRAASR
ncbi:entericidin [Rhizobiaceae bacterium BDR2-2]|uniref:Entericidin n=1 Tax=Ectorhizobium quercum TaxID=2965071 RepID=A0AAE3SXH3_9HYPH|nr:entericidin [Ectorhizobium quercum]MCX8999773.1 entericidin [Ectorhizobium quercum]